MCVIENRKTVCVAQDVSTVPGWKSPIRIEFIPDEVIVRQLVFGSSDDPIVPFVNLRVTSGLINDDCLCIFPLSTSVCVNLDNHFQLNKSVNGDVSFQLEFFSNANNSWVPQPADISTSRLSLLLEFVKYKK